MSKKAVLRTAQDIFVLDKAFFLIEGHPSREGGFVVLIQLFLPPPTLPTQSRRDLIFM
jgi:hypothetical protein